MSSSSSSSRRNNRSRLPRRPKVVLESSVRFFVTLPPHPRGSFGKYLEEQEIAFNRLNDHGRSAHVSVATEDVDKLMKLETFFGHQMEIVEAKPLVSALEVDFEWLVVDFRDEEAATAFLVERGYTLKIRITPPKKETKCKLMALRTEGAVKTRALPAAKVLADEGWVKNLSPGCLVFSVPNIFAVGGLVDALPPHQLSKRSTDSVKWVHIQIDVEEDPEDVEGDEDADGGVTGDEGDEFPDQF